jgi:hypothetical protein
MGYGKPGLLGMALMASLAVPAFAQSPAEQGPFVYAVVVHSMDGKMTIVPIDAARQTELAGSSHAKQLAAGVVIMVVDGKTFLIDDHKMPNGDQMIKTILSGAGGVAG